MSQPKSPYFIFHQFKNRDQKHSLTTHHHLDIAQAVQTAKKSHHYFIADQIQPTARGFEWTAAVGVKLNLQTQDLNNVDCIEADEFGLAPVFFYQNQHEIFASSHMQILLQLIPRPAISRKNLEAFKAQGFVDVGETLFENIFKLKASTRLVRFDSGKWHVQDFNNSPLFTENISDDWIDEALAILRTNTIRIVESGCYQIALSGGCDSRLILALMPPDLRKNIFAYTKVHPSLPSSIDNDAAIAVELARRIAIKHELIEGSKDYKAFLVPENNSTKQVKDIAVISGLYGGELLGGYLYVALPAHVSGRFVATPTSNEQLFWASIGSSRTQFYSCIDYSWALPYTLPYQTQSPFLQSQFIKHIARLKFTETTNYKAYHRIWQRPEFTYLRDIPFQSQLGFFFDYPHRSNGVDPKLTAYAKQRDPVSQQQPLNAQVEANIKFYLSQAFVDSADQSVLF